MFHATFQQYMQLLSELVAVADSLELWRVDCLLHGELSLKLCCLLEARAKKQEAPPILDFKPVTFVNYDRPQLLNCQQELEKVVAFVKASREGEVLERASKGTVKESATDLAILHAECVYTLTRIRVKLASTNLPPGETQCMDILFAFWRFYIFGNHDYLLQISLCPSSQC